MGADAFRLWIVRLITTAAGVALVVFAFPTLPLWAFVLIGLGIVILVDGVYH